MFEAGKQLITQWFAEVFGEGNIETLKEITTSDFVAHAPGGEVERHEREQFIEWLQWYRQTFTDDHWQIKDLISEGNRVVARYIGSSTYRGGLLDIPSHNQRITETGIIIFHIEHGKIKEIWPEMSDLQVMQQLGAFPSE